MGGWLDGDTLEYLRERERSLAGLGIWEGLAVEGASRF